MLFQQAVDVLDLDPGAGGDPLLARGVQQVRLLAFSLGHRADDRDLAGDHLVVDIVVGHLGLHLGHARQHAHDALQPAHLGHLLQLGRQIIEIELALGQFLGHGLGLGLIQLLAGLLDQGDDIALTEDATGDPAGVEHVERIDLLARAQIFDRQASHRPHRQHGPAATVAVGASQDQAGQRQTFVEGGSCTHRILTGQAVGDQQGLDRVRHPGDLCHLVHQGLVERDPPGGVEDQDIEALEFGRLQRPFGDLDGRLALDDRQGHDLDLLAEGRQLFHRRRTTGVQRGHHDLLAIELRQAQRQLGRGRGLARALQAGHQDHGRRRGVDVQRGRLLATQHFDQTVIDDLDHLIGRLDRADHVLARGAFGGESDEVLDHRQGDVGLQQGHAHFAHRLGDVLFGQRAAPGNPVENACQSLVQGLEHTNLMPGFASGQDDLNPENGRSAPTNWPGPHREISPGDDHVGRGFSPGSSIAVCAICLRPT